MGVIINKAVGENRSCGQFQQIQLLLPYTNHCLMLLLAVIMFSLNTLTEAVESNILIN